MQLFNFKNTKITGPRHGVALQLSWTIPTNYRFWECDLFLLFVGSGNSIKKAYN